MVARRAAVSIALVLPLSIPFVALHCSSPEKQDISTPTETTPPCEASDTCAPGLPLPPVVGDPLVPPPCGQVSGLCLPGREGGNSAEALDAPDEADDSDASALPDAVYVDGSPEAQ